MKKLITLLLILFAVQGMAQTTDGEPSYTTPGLNQIEGSTIFEPGDTVKWVYEVPKTFITVEDLEQWIGYCSLDTIIATQFQDMFIIDHGNYREMVSEKQLKRMGYKYSHIFIVGGDPLEMEHYFISLMYLLYLM